MSSTNENTKPPEEPAATVSAPAPFNPFAAANRLPSPIETYPKMTPDELEMALIELVVETAWMNAQRDLKEAKTAAERRKIRLKEMHAVLTSAETANTLEAQEAVDGRIRLLEWGTEVDYWEEKYWYSRL